MKRNIELARKITRLITGKLPKKKEVFINAQSFFNLISTLYKKNREFRNFMINPSIPKEKKVALIEGLMNKSGLPQDIKGIFEYIISINAFSVIPDVSRMLEHETEKIMKLSHGKLIIGHKVDKKTISKLSKIVEEKIGRKIDLEVEENPDIIGGFILKTHGFIIDASVKRQLEKLITVKGG